MYDQTADNLGIHHFVDQDGRVSLLLQQVFDFLHEGIVDIYSRGDGGNLDIVAAVIDLDEVLENVTQRGLSPLFQDEEEELQGDVVHFAVEKGFQDGGKTLREKGLRVESLAIIEKMDENGIVFC